jgi:hypothetical protein
VVVAKQPVERVGRTDYDSPRGPPGGEPVEIAKRGGQAADLGAKPGREPRDGCGFKTGASRQQTDRSLHIERRSRYGLRQMSGRRPAGRRGRGDRAAKGGIGRCQSPRQRLRRPWNRGGLRTLAAGGLRTTTSTATDQSRDGRENEEDASEPQTAHGDHDHCRRSRKPFRAIDVLVGLVLGLVKRVHALEERS